MDLNIDGWRISVGGDSEGGWLVDIHDGTNAAVYSPEGADAEAAKSAAVSAHKEAFYPQPKTEMDAQHPIEPAGDTDAADLASAPPPETSPTSGNVNHPLA
jgi:hypothetical protein